MPRERAKKDSEIVDPAEWIIRKQFTYDSISYSRGEPIPSMTEAEADHLRLVGAIAKRTPEGLSESRTARKPKNVAEYLRGPDLRVLQMVRMHPPSLEVLHDIADRAHRQGRTVLFHEAIAIAIELRTLTDK